MTIIDDPTKNFTLSANDALGLNIPEVVFFNLIGFTFKQLAATVQDPDNLVDQLFSRLRADVRKSIKAWLVTHQNITLTVNWPREDTALPCISIITESEEEDEGLATLSDYTGVHTLGTYDAGPQSARINFKVGLGNATNIVIFTEDPSLTLYLGAIVRYALLRNKTALTALYDIHALTVSAQDLKWDERYLPTFAYMRQLSLRYKTFFDINVSEKTSVITSLELMVATAEDGTIVDTTVPYTEE